MISSIRRSTGRLRVALIAFALVGTMTSPASAHTAADGPEHAFGEMVDYPLVHPLAGPFDLPFDSFYSGRADGIHHAQDLMADKLTPVVAVADGIVQRVNWSRDPNNLNESRCCTIVLIHDDGWESWYIHLNNDTPGTDDGLGWGIAPGILPGTRVAAGELIGWVGDSGNAESTAPHLHYELRDPYGTIVNPYQSLLAAAGVEVDPGQFGTAGAGGTTACSVPEDASPLLDGTEVLRRGSRGVAVEVLQEILEMLGFDTGTPDGVFGRRTDLALRAFQEARGITVDGLFGFETRTTMRAELELIARASILYSGGTLRPGDRGDAVLDLQAVLRLGGYERLGAAGFYGPRTEAAVRRLQRATGIVIDGKVGPQTRGALIDLLELDALGCTPVG